VSQPWIPAGVRSGLQTHTAATENGEIAANGVGVIINSNGQLGTVLSSARNTAIGTDALASPTSGRYNTAMGEGALTNNTVDGNTAIGDEAMIRIRPGYAMWQLDNRRWTLTRRATTIPRTAIRPFGC